MLAVIYDTAESIKDVEEFSDYAQDGFKRDKVVPNANCNTMKSPDFKKASRKITV